MLSFLAFCKQFHKFSTSTCFVSSVLQINSMGKRNISKVAASDELSEIPRKRKKGSKFDKKSKDGIITPTRNKDGVFIFEDEPRFCPNMSPKEVLQAGSFGGTYFRPIRSGVTKKSYGSEVWKELPEDWLEGLNIKKVVASPIYDVNVNKYKAKCGSSLDAWETSNWIRAQDPYGWFQWYCRFFLGRRSPDDERQIGRWLRCAGVTGRWRNNLITKVYKAGVAYDNPAVSPVVRQVLLHWGYKLTEKDYKAKAVKLQKANK